MKDFLRGMASIALFPRQRRSSLETLNILPEFKILSNEEAFKKDQEAIAQDMWNAIQIINTEYPETRCK